MTPDSFWISIRLVFTGFAIYRLLCFTAKHRAIETAGLYGLLILLMSFSIHFQNPLSPFNSWTYAFVYSSILLFIFEPEWTSFFEKAIEYFKKTALSEKSLEEIVKVSATLASTKTGALMAFERTDNLLQIAESGITINADIKSELITSLFTKDTQTHDGGAIVRGNKITHCAVIFPLTRRTDLPNDLGTRHRAAIGLSEHTDAVCLVISEESGSISLTVEGELLEHVEIEKLGKLIKKLLHEKRKNRFLPVHYLRRFSLKRDEMQMIQFEKSFGHQIYITVVLTFWLLFAFLINHTHFQPPALAVLETPWLYAPIILAASALLSFLTNHSFHLNGMGQSVLEEKKFLGVRFFSKNYPVEYLHSVQLKKEFGGIQLWSLFFVHRKKSDAPKKGKRKGRQKVILIERTSNPKLLNEWAQKIGAALNLQAATSI